MVVYRLVSVDEKSNEELNIQDKRTIGVPLVGHQYYDFNFTPSFTKKEREN